MFQLTAPLILASQSPRRQQLLRDAGFSFEVQVRPTDETFPPGATAREAAICVAETKARCFDDLCQSHIILTADTVVAIDNHLLAKPADTTEAAEMLRALSGRSHSVVTGIALYHQNKLISSAIETLVSFKELTDTEIAYYINQYKPFDKAGSYGIQEWIGMIGIMGIRGDYYNVMGLPVSTIYQELAYWKV